MRGFAIMMGGMCLLALANARVGDDEDIAKLNSLIDLEDEFEGGIEENNFRYTREQVLPDDFIEDPCLLLHCDAGRSCVIGDDGKGACRCIVACEGETDPRRRVCSNHNETWMTDCDLHRQRCLCEDELQDCQAEHYKHLHIDYYGQCQELPECADEEFADFPRRMREWLFNVMRDMADREILSTHYQQLEQEAEEDVTQKWTKAVVWKWCDLDGFPRDKMVSRHELFPLRAPLYTLEHCIAPFLDSCDPNGDHNITLKEWADCLDLDKEEVADMEDLCEDIRDFPSFEE